MFNTVFRKKWYSVKSFLVFRKIYIWYSEKYNGIQKNILGGIQKNMGTLRLARGLLLEKETSFCGTLPVILLVTALM